MPGKKAIAGHSLVELTVVIAIVTLLTAVGIFAGSTYIAHQQGISASVDLRAIFLAQKKSVEFNLSQPTALATNFPGCIQLPYLEANNFLATNTVFHFVAPGSYRYETMPPISTKDGSLGDAIKKPGVAASGDGVYDIGPEN